MNIRLISKPGCTYCTQAKELLKVRALDFTEDARVTPEQQQAFIAEGHRTYPRVFIDDVLIGGFTELRDHLIALVEPALDDF